MSEIKKIVEEWDENRNCECGVCYYCVKRNKLITSLEKAQLEEIGKILIGYDLIQAEKVKALNRFNMRVGTHSKGQWQRRIEEIFGEEQT